MLVTDCRTLEGAAALAATGRAVLIGIVRLLCEARAAAFVAAGDVEPRTEREVPLVIERNAHELVMNDDSLATFCDRVRDALLPRL